MSLFWSGSRGADRIPIHVAKKKVPHLDEHGQEVKPERENALKFERFIFDVLPLAERWTLVETSRHEEFEPLKNATGPDSPETVRRALCDLAADWLAGAGVEVARDPAGNAAAAMEISPLLALDANELAAKLKDKDACRGRAISRYDGFRVSYYLVRGIVKRQQQ